MPREKSCGAVVFKENADREYLLLHYESGHWDFVKGNVEISESEKETVLRELQEETGITRAEFIEDFREQITYYYRRGGETIYKEVIFFLIKTKDLKVTLSHEHIGFKWLKYPEAVRKLTFENAKKVLRKAHST